VSTLRAALGEYDLGWQSPRTSLERAAEVISRASSVGARLVALPEMCLTGFTMDPESFAEPLDGPNVRRLAELARAAGVELLASIARRSDTPSATGRQYFNSVVHVDGQGEAHVVYDKQKLFGYGGEDGKFSPGMEPPTTVVVDGVRIASFVCYDLRFPELFREVADNVDAIFVLANWPAARRPHWDALLRARAIENQCWVIGVNRTGEGGRLAYDGGSAAFDPWGEGADRSGVVDLSTERVEEIRTKFPFLRDRTSPLIADR
jgi:omega-amidase